MLETYKYGWNRPGNRKFKPPIIPFIKPRYMKFMKDAIALQTSKRVLIETIADEVNKYDINFKESSKYDWYKEFWAKCEIKWDITTLNYDTTIENSFNNNIEDGFEDSGDNYYRFNPLKFLNTKESTNSMQAIAAGSVLIWKFVFLL
jgi:hypothetical protein